MLDDRITNTFIGTEYGWDRLSEARLDLLQNNRAAMMRVLDNPEQFPKADFDACRTMVLEIDAFLAQYEPLLREFA